jgi:hypothetical protein
VGPGDLRLLHTVWPAGRAQSVHNKEKKKKNLETRYFAGAQRAFRLEVTENL